MHLDFDRNVGNTDRTIRIILGVLALVVTPWLSLSPSVKWLLYILGSFSMVEGILGY